MNALVIGANEDSIKSMQIARKYGFVIYAIDGNKYAKGLAEADYSYVIDINDLEKVFSITDAIKPTVVLPAPIGHCLTTVGAVNDRYGLPGVSEKSAVLCTDKYKFSEVLEKNNLRNADTILLCAGADNKRIIDKIKKYPVIVKPKTGSGSRGVEVFASKKALLEWVESIGKADEDFTVESFISGDEYGIDGAFSDGEFYLILLRKKINTAPPYRQCVGYISVSPDEDTAFYNSCIEIMKKIGDVLELRNCVLHADVIKDEFHKPFVIETSARPSGHNLSNYFTPRVTGINEVEEYIKSVLNQPFSYVCKKTEKMMIRFFDLPTGVVSKVPAKEEILEIKGVEDYRCNIKAGDRIDMVIDGASVMGRGFYLIKGDSEKELFDIDTSIRSRFIIKPEM